MELPEIGFGCSPFRGNGVLINLAQAVEYALDIGYRLFDLAELYGNEREVGEKLRGPKAPAREEIYVVSKVWNTNHSYKHVIAACERTLTQLGLEYVDAYLIHSPDAWKNRGPLNFPGKGGLEKYYDLTFPKDEMGHIEKVNIPIAETWQAMEELFNRGLAKKIGLSNFSVKEISQIIAFSEIPPTVVEIEVNPYRRNDEVRSYCREQRIKVIGYTPLAYPDLLNDPLVKSLVGKYNKSAAQIILRWAVQRNVIPIPSSTQKNHILANISINDFNLSKTDLTGLDRLERTRVDGSIG
jgi:diketogulonate reductase-like aldo/keto reductase